jgi:hypothetical protein
MPKRQSVRRGFSLVEVVIAAGMFALCTMLIVQTVRSALGMLAAQAQAARTHSALDDFASRLQREAISSDAVWISGQGANAALNFAQLDQNGNTRRWQYVFTKHLQRNDLLTGQFVDVPAAQALTGFTLASLPASRMSQSESDEASFFSGIPSARDALYTVDSGGVAGNQVSVVTLQSGVGRRVVHLLSGASAEGFGVESGVLWHSVIWRTTTTRRFFLGLGQKTNYHIMGEVAYTTDNWHSSHVWCSYDIYGPLDVSDPRAQATYTDKAQQASALFSACSQKTGQETISATQTPAQRLFQ